MSNYPAQKNESASIKPAISPLSAALLASLHSIGSALYGTPLGISCSRCLHRRLEQLAQADQVVGDHVQDDRPAEQQVVVELLKQQPLRADSTKRLLQRGQQQLLRRNRGMTSKAYSLQKVGLSRSRA